MVNLQRTGPFTASFSANASRDELGGIGRLNDSERADLKATALSRQIREARAKGKVPQDVAARAESRLEGEIDRLVADLQAH